jgi:phosphoribosylamine--glycine ligase
LEKAAAARPDVVIVGPEEPLAIGIVDDLGKLGIPAVGPVQALAQLEASKSFTRELLSRHRIDGNPRYRVFRTMDGITDYLSSLQDHVIKPDGLTGGKGVKVSGEHLHSVQEGLDYCEQLFAEHPEQPVVIEEKLDGEEFSLQSFCDGEHVVHTVPVQDHKRAFDGDSGPNTGGMGSYSAADHLLPFLTREDLLQAQAINAAVVRALHKETGQPYKGILFGGFMLTRDGIRLLEYNARFGDPESLNVLCLLEGDDDFVDICLAIINGNLDEVRPRFKRQATVCTYVVPQGYPDSPVQNQRVDLSRVPTDSEHLKRFFAAVDQRDDGIYLTGSRAIAFVGIGQDLADAYRHAEGAASRVQGPVRHRKDIGTEELIQKRVRHMAEVRQRRVAV